MYPCPKAVHTCLGQDSTVSEVTMERKLSLKNKIKKPNIPEMEVDLASR